VEFTRITRKFIEVFVTATLPDGEVAPLAGVDVSLLTPHATPGDDTVWTPATYADGMARILVAGPEADPSGALPLATGGADLWIRVTDNPEIEAVKVERITVA
jgi:hypothetical protein